MSIKDKRILITAGPTWVAIDSVRVISNIATGETGILLAKEAKQQGAKVTLLLGPVETGCLDKKIKLVRFKFFDELQNKLIKELHPKKYDVIIHSAAVADYQPKKVLKNKISSGLKNLTIKLVPTPKLIDAIKKIDCSLFLVGFKFKPHSEKSELISQARALIQHCEADLVVANTVYNGRYRAYIVNQKKVKGTICSKEKLARLLIKEIGERDYGRT